MLGPPTWLLHKMLKVFDVSGLATFWRLDLLLHDELVSISAVGVASVPVLAKASAEVRARC